MKCVMIFLVLSLVVLMAEPGEGFLRSVWRAGKSMFTGARQRFRVSPSSRYRQKYEKEPEEPERHRYA
uniref:Uncharacterized protein n=1 Tax=Poecilia latipinna TaxID=48699 RepID=A0A3B3VK89_9TELE